MAATIGDRRAPVDGDISGSPPGDTGAIRRRLAAAPTWVFVLYATAAAFSVYFCMYAFRKPFSAATYEGLSFFGTKIDLKTALVISQLLGYTLSKFVGIKVCSEVTRARRLATLIGLILVAELALVLFAVLPTEWKFAAIFLNGLPLGMIWGLVVWYLEGRRTSELLLAGLSCSFIIASGVVKDVGRWLMSDLGISEFWMPAAAGAIFIGPLVVASLLLNLVPDPDAEDEAARTHREPMNGAHRIAFLYHFGLPLAMLCVVYFFLTAYRDFRDNYGVEIFTSLGYGDRAGLFTQTEFWVGLGVLIRLAALTFVRDNRWGLAGAFAIMLTGAAMMGVGTLLLDAGAIDGLTWMILAGLGAYLAYVPFGSVLFDRMIASTRVVGTAVFAIYVADALGYTGSVAVQLYKDLFAGGESRFEFFRVFTYFMSVLALLLLTGSCVYILGRTGRAAKAAGDEPEAGVGLAAHANVAHAGPR